LELGGKDLLAVEQDVDPVAAHHRAARVPYEGRAERGLVDPEIGQLQVRLDVAAARQQQEEAEDGDHVVRPPPTRSAHSLRRTSMRSPVSGCVLRKPPPPPPPSALISQVRVLIITSLFRPTRLSRSTP